MRFDDFERLIHRLAEEVPAEFLEGVAGIEVSRKTLPHPERDAIYTLGECIPLPAEGDPGSHQLHSRVVLYHGSFAALAAERGGFDWRAEAWETLTHELRHHLEWRARAPDLEAFDWAAEQNFARQAGEPFDPAFHLSAERVGAGVYRIDDDFFLDLPARSVPAELRFRWHGRAYRAAPPAGCTVPAFLEVEGVAAPPPGDLVLVLRRRPRVWDLFRRQAAPFEGAVTAASVRDSGESAPGPR